jgi:hypothetical protein
LRGPAVGATPLSGGRGAMVKSFEPGVDARAMGLEAEGRTLRKKFNPIKVARESVVRRYQSQRCAAGIKVETPLAELSEALDDEHEAEKFIGDPMFWRHFMDIDQLRVFRPTSVEFRNLRIMFWEWIAYMFFLFLFTLFIFALQSPDVYESKRQQLDYWLGCDASGCAIDRVKDITSFWSWSQNDLLNKAFPTVLPPEIPVANITTAFAGNEYSIIYRPRMVGETNTNILLGTIRSRQLRVQKNQGCEVSSLYRHAFPDCYNTFNGEIQSKEPYDSRYTPMYLVPSYQFSCSDQTSDSCERRTSRTTDMSEIQGSLAATPYPGDGYFYDVPADLGEARVMLGDLYDWNWVDSATRAVVYEMTVLNSNTNVVVNLQILFEFGPTGSVKASQQVQGYRVLFLTWAFNEGDELVVGLFQVVVCVMFAVMAAYMFWLCRRTGLVKFLTFPWNTLDVMNICLWCVYCYQRYNVLQAISSEASLQPAKVGHPMHFMAFSKYFYDLQNASKVLSFLTLFAWLRLMKYAVFFGSLRLLQETVMNCIHRLMVFAVLIVVMFLGFGLSFFIGVGQDSSEFTTFGQSFAGLFFRFIEGISIDASWFEPMGGPGRLVGPFISVSFLLGTDFVLANIFMAIVVESYVGLTVAAKARATEADLTKRNPMFLFLYTYYHTLRKLSLLTDDEALPEERSIPLHELPGIVVRKWHEKKKRMQLLVDKELGDLTEEDMQRMIANMEGGPESNAARANKKKTTLERLTKLCGAIQRGMSLPEASDFEVLEPEQQHTRVRLYGNVRADDEEEISLQQLQSLMDGEPMLQILLGTKNAIDVIKYFKTFPKDEEDEPMPSKMMEDKAPEKTSLEKVAELQENVFRKVETLEKAKLNMERLSVPYVDEMADSIQFELNNSQNEWRQQLTGIMEVLTQITDAFTDVKKSIDNVQSNHVELTQLLTGESEGSETGTESSSESTEEEDQPVQKSSRGSMMPKRRMTGF